MTRGIRRFLSPIVLAAILLSLLPVAALAAPLRAITVSILEAGAATGYSTSLALDAQGNPLISYIGDLGLKLAICHDPGCSAPTIKILDGAQAIYGTSLVLDGSGNPVISYRSTSSELKLARCADPLCNTVTTSVVDGSSSGEYSSLRLTSAGLPVISYRGGNALKLALCSDPLCNSATLLTLDGANLAGLGTSLALDGAGRPVVSYHNGTAPTRDLMLARCDQADCTTFQIITVDSVGEVGSNNSLELDPDGFPVISYYDGTNHTLKLAHCHDATCSSASLEVVDGGDLQFTSLELDPDGFPVISYVDVTNGDLKLARCNSLDCTSALVSTLDDRPFGLAGPYNSLKLDCANNPVISYQFHIGGSDPSATRDLLLLNDDSTDCSEPASTSTSNIPSASKPIASSGVTSLQLGRIHVSVPASAIPTGQTSCSLTITEAGESGAFGFTLDDTVWDVKVLCNGSEVDIFFDALTICIQPVDGVLGNKNVYHSHNGGSFNAMAGGELPGYVCGQTRLLSLFTLGQLALPATGFVPGVVTQLGEQPSELAYVSSSLTLSIPKLGVALDIVGVPQSPNGWDVSWLQANQAGYLYGTSFPTWQGNSVLTAHVWNADNTSGPFYGLSSLQHGDRFTVVYDGSSYTYEVRSNQLVLPSSLRPLADSNYSLITLITCESFSEASGEYLYRRAVQAVLVSIN